MNDEAIEKAVSKIEKRAAIWQSDATHYEARGLKILNQFYEGRASAYRECAAMIRTAMKRP